MLKIRHRFALAAWVLFCCTGAQAQPVSSDKFIVTREGLSLYTFDNDVAGSGRSVCNAPCSNIFPPYLAGEADRGDGAFSLITRDDGARQWAHLGRPLYRFYADEKPGEQGGDGLNRNLWHLARPQ